MNKILTGIFVVIVVALIGYGIYYASTTDEVEEEPVVEEEEKGEIEVLLDEIEQASGLDFLEQQEVEFNWWVVQQDKTTTSTSISGRGFSIEQSASNTEAVIESALKDKGFQMNKYNIAAGTMSGAVGYQKGMTVCLLTVQLLLDENDEPLESGQMDAQVKCGLGGPEVLLQTDQTEVISRAIGEEFIISLVSNASTGYGWQVEFDQEVLELIEREFIAPPKSEMVGVPGQEHFKFKGLVAGETEITFSLLREWEEGEEPAEVKVFEVVIFEPAE